MNTVFRALLSVQFLIVVFVIYPACAKDVKPATAGFAEMSGSFGNEATVLAPSSLYYQIFMPAENRIIKHMSYSSQVYQTWSFTTLSDTWTETLNDLDPAIYNDLSISSYLSGYQYRYSYLPVTRLPSNRFYQRLILVLTPHDKYKIPIFSNLALQKVKFTSDNVYLDFEGKITQNLTYNFNFDLNTDSIYADPARLIDFNHSSIPDLTLTLRYNFY